MTGDDSETVEVSLDADEVERLRAVTDDPEDLLHDAAMHRVRREESIAALRARQSGEADAAEQSRADREVALAPVGVTVGFEPVEIGGGESRVAMQAGPEHANPMGTVHGGVLCDLGDAAMGMAVASTLDEGESFTTLELSVNFLRPVFEERLEARGEVVSEGRTISLVECEVRNADEDLVAKLSSTCMTLRGDDAEGR